ncbi:UNVERIFIED_ORG: hypothetical protein LHJ69_00425 [Shinella sp. XGS7]|nr:hypothetical protein [Shinella sp. XGS7]
MNTKVRRQWKRIQPNSLRHALELCKDHAREKLNRSVERIADEMGVADHWTVYKWLQTGRIPANLIRPFETACGIDYVTRWLAGSSGRLLIEMPSGRALKSTDVVALHGSFAEALQLLTDYYAGKGKTAPEEALAALTLHLEQVCWHRANVAQFSTPELDFSA